MFRAFLKAARPAPSGSLLSRTTAARHAISCTLEPLETRVLFTGTNVITGVIFNDLNHDGIRQGTEPLLPNVTVYLDLNNHGSFQAGDPTAVTNAGGRYQFKNLNFGTYQVGEIVPAGQLQVNPAGATAPVWQELGPAPALSGSVPGMDPVSGRVTAITPDPNNSSIYYVGGADGGLWKTFDDGLNWVFLTDNQITLTTGSIAVAKSDSNVIYVGTGEPNNSGDSRYGRGILKSVNGGLNWELVGQTIFDGESISRIVVDPGNSNILYAAVHSGLGGPAGGTVRGIFRSADGGYTWVDTTATISTTPEASDLVMDPTNSQVLYAAFGNLHGDATNGIYKTTNGGGSWTPLASGAPSGQNAGRISIAVSGDGQTLYAAASDPVSDNSGHLLGLYQSTNAGVNWTRKTNTPNYMGNIGWYANAIIVDPTNSQRVYVGGGPGNGAVLRSDDGGTTWNDITTGVDGHGLHDDHHAFAFDPNGNLLEGNDGGIWKTSDRGAHWVDLNTNLGITQFYGISIDPAHPTTTMWGGTQDNGTMQFVTSSISWNILFDGDGGAPRINPGNTQQIYTERQHDGNAFFYRSDDGGNQFIEKDAGINLSDAAHFTAPYALDASDPTHLILGATQIYQTTNSADSWSTISPQLAGGNETSAVSIAAGHPNVLYASFDDGSIWSTTNDGGAWTKSATNVNGVNQIAVDPNNSAHAYLVAQIYGAGKVYETTNGGTSWSDISGDLPDFPARCIVLDPRTTVPAIYVGTDAGVYQSTNDGATWVRFGEQLANAVAQDLQLSQTTNQLFVATHGRGVWMANLSGPTAANEHQVQLIRTYQRVRNVNFGNQTPTITGQLFNDRNANFVQDTGETGLGNRTLYLDANNNGRLDPGETTTLTDSNGNYTFTDLTTGTYTVRQVTPGGWRPTDPQPQFYSVTLGSAQLSSGNNFATTQNVLIRGRVFNDANHDGFQDNGETGLAGWTVYIDSNNNSHLDPGEPAYTTNGNGAYHIIDQPAGTYHIGVNAPAGYTATTPAAKFFTLNLSAGQASAGNLFGFMPTTPSIVAMRFPATVDPLKRDLKNTILSDLLA